MKIGEVRDDERLACKRKYFKVDALATFEPMDRFEKRI
jgi:hypothetical protein